MAARLILPVWTSCYDCVQWSECNQIAVLAGESLVIITPRLEKAGPEGNFWDSTIIASTGFTGHEVPSMKPLSTGNFSFGEEISPWQIFAGSWSHPGLARHGNCALALLTTNHVLSIWAVNGLPTINHHWERAVIVNKAVAEHYRDRKLDTDRAWMQDEWEIVRQRIFAFAWSPLVICADSEHIHFLKHLRTGMHMLAVATGAGDILVLQIHSPFNLLQTAEAWNIEVVASFKVPFFTSSENVDDQMSGDNINSQSDKVCMATEITWGEWMKRDESTDVAMLAFNAMRRIYQVEISVSKEPSGIVSVNADSASMKSCLPDEHADARGPLAYVPTSDSSKLIAFGDNTVFQIDTNNKAWESHHLDGRWDDVTGITFVSDDHSRKQLHIVSHLSSTTAPTAQIMVPFATERAHPSASTAWRRLIEESKDHYNIKHGLGGHVLDRTWGIASSPLGDCIATCSTMYSSHAIAYVIPSEYAIYLNISWACSSPEIVCSTGAMSASSDTVLFTLKRYLERIDVPLEDEMTKSLCRGILERTLVAVDQAELEYEPTTVPDRQKLINHLRFFFFFHPTAQNLRISRIAELAVKITRDGQISRDSIAFIVREMLTLADLHPPQDSSSRRLISIYRTVSQKLQSSTSSSRSMTGNASADSTERPPAYEEQCNLCCQAIPLESLKWARCANGHHFSRCALSFMAIQKPGITKSCGVCGLDFMKEYELDRVNAAETDTVSVRVDSSLAEILFTACHICVYCGGRYV